MKFEYSNYLNTRYLHLDAQQVGLTQLGKNILFFLPASPKTVTQKLCITDNEREKSEREKKCQSQERVNNCKKRK
jgi:hypothetical protein